ncbi:DUF302 domain-containing protein [Mycobacterium sp. ITM-2016-00317]|uniref:DUF302 domain-containing protein n=1 Tax=Mycobacterium sp. ITM-2016-00317 TaxID=2099694 RepID=UPI000D49E899|nr:DUF302 domain-containing protein [Mycobacterium sp. ITM-2016-00317]WNG89496.1 DUF302 domain-containing protein [Mycobacterium sp. ITM-2016-00317]
MSDTVPQRIPFHGVRVRHESEKSFDALVRALMADVGDTPVRIEDIAAASADWTDYRARVEPHVGPHGFMLFATLDHGGWITKAGIERKVLRVIIGNPLIAITMLRHDVTAGLFAPVELLLADEPADRSSLTYVQPSTLMVVTPNAELSAAARELDVKLAALASAVT